MPKTNYYHFEAFKKEVERWLKKFGLSYLEISFEHVSLEEGMADVTVIEHGSATIRFNLNWPEDKIEEKDIFNTAKHEAIHVLLSKYVLLAESRYVREDELHNEEEHLVRRLIKLIK